MGSARRFPGWFTPARPGGVGIQVTDVTESAAFNFLESEDRPA